jgi:hypothetical protein
VRAHELDAPSREVAKLRGARTTVDPDHGRTVGSGTPSPIARSGIQKLKGVIFDFMSSEVPRAVRGDTRQNHKVGPGSRPADTRHMVEGVNTSLTSSCLGDSGDRKRRFGPSTREGASCERSEH